MLDVAQKYTGILKLKFAETIYDEKYKFFSSGWIDEYKSSDTTWHTHEFVSVKDGEVIGYIAYTINRNEYDVSGLKAINFSENKIVFGLDLLKVIDDIFKKFNFRKLSFGVYVGNPIEKSYDRLIRKYGGRIVGIKIEDTRLIDGKFYDFKMYEIFKNEYIANTQIKKRENRSKFC